MFKKNVLGKNGFTLIELLVVIAIIAILATVIWVALGSARKKAKDSAVQQDVRNVMTAVEMYITDNNNPPASFQELKDAGLIQQAPKHPVEGKSYSYSKNGSDYVMCGVLTTGEFFYCNSGATGTATALEGCPTP